jgi:hypothetical protein
VSTYPIALLVVVSGCSEYEFNPGEASDTDATEVADPTDTFEDTADVVEDTGLSEEAYCTPFDNFDDWSWFGDGNWSIVDGRLLENRAGQYASIAFLDDLGTSDHWSVEVDTAWTANANDRVGFAFGVDPATESYTVLRWDDPNGYYGRYQPTGAFDLQRCVAGECVVLAADASTEAYWPDDDTFVTWSLEVEGDVVRVVVDGALLWTVTVPEIRGVGPGVVGLLSDDNDGGVRYDDYCVRVE